MIFYSENDPFSCEEQKSPSKLKNSKSKDSSNSADSQKKAKPMKVK